MPANDKPGSRPADAGAPASPARDFDREPEAAPMTPEEQAAADAIEKYAQENARRARERLLAERAARSAAAPGAPGAVAPPAAPPPPPFQPTPGKERWPVKTVTDGDQGQVVDQAPTSTTVEDMWLLDRPADMPLTRATPEYQSKRAPGPETTIWQIKGTIIAYKWEQDGDYHIVLQGDTSGYTMIVESPQNDTDGVVFVGDSPFKERITAARLKLQQRLSPTPAFVSDSIPAVITGIGFFDILHGQNGVATTNAVELHPILDVQFGS